MTHDELDRQMFRGWGVRMSRLTEEFTLDDWRAENPESILVAAQKKGGDLRLLHTGENLKGEDEMRLFHLAPPRERSEARENAKKAKQDAVDGDEPSAA